MEKQKMDRKQEKFKILKFGGTSLGTVERIKHVANLICNNELNLVVLSAMSGTTNSLAMTKKKVEVNEDVLKNIIVGDIPVFGREKPAEENAKQPEVPPVTESAD